MSAAPAVGLLTPLMLAMALAPVSPVLKAAVILGLLH
jgi:hypothetical protein